MSLGTLLQKVGTWIAGIFHKAADEIENVILPAAISVTNALKGVLEVDSTDVIGAIAGAAGKAMEDKLRGILESIVPQLQLAQQFKGQDPNTILSNIVKLVGTSPTITKTAFWIEFSGMVAQAWANDGKIDLAEANALAKYWYENEVAAPAAAEPVPETTE